MFWILQISQAEEADRKKRLDRERQLKRLQIASQVGSTAAAMDKIGQKVKQDAQAGNQQANEAEKSTPTTSSLGDVLDRGQTPTRGGTPVPQPGGSGAASAPGGEASPNGGASSQDQENQEWENKEWDARTAHAKQQANENEEWENKEWDARLAHAKAGAAKDAAAKIPGAGAAIEGFEKMFPILWYMFGLKFKPEANILIKILCYFGLIITLVVVWPLLATLSFLKFRNFILIKLPETNGMELVASFMPLFVIFFILLVFSFIFICAPTIQGTVQRFLMKLIYDISIDCGF